MSKYLVLAGLVLASVFSATESQAQWMRSMTSCYATTMCQRWVPGPFGPMPQTYPISCMVYADVAGGSACRWMVAPGQAVRCEGMTDMGFWQVYEFHCN